MSNGVLYIASGSEYVEEAKKSAETVKKHTELPVTIVSDRDLSDSCFDTVIQSDDFCYHYGDSVLQIPDLPYEKTLLLDTDTYLYDNIDELFELMDRFDIAASTIADSEFELSEKVPESFPEYNTGVVMFKKNEGTKQFIEEWKSVYREYLDNGVRMNQPAFRETLYSSSLSVTTLPTEYNCRANFGGYLNNSVKILHGSFENPDTVLEELNTYESPRLFIKTEDGMKTERINTIKSSGFSY
jgi:hypothetical protein